MKIKLIAFISFTLLLAVAGTIRTLSVGKQPLFKGQISEPPGTLKWHAKKAKEKGEKEVKVATPIYNYATVNSLDEAAAHYYIYIAQPVEIKTVISSPKNITTWYKFRIIEDLSKENLQFCSTCSSVINPPEDMLPLKENEILIPKAGGTVDIDGVRVTKEENDFPQFSTSHTYLLFLDLDASKKIGKFSMGPNGVFEIASNEEIRSVNENRRRLKDEIKNLYGNSLTQLKKKLKK